MISLGTTTDLVSKAGVSTLTVRDVDMYVSVLFVVVPKCETMVYTLVYSK